MNKKKKSISSQPRPLPYLPEEVIIIILTLLPVKTLIRFKCVSKSWLNLISNPSFINTHLVKSSKSFNFTQNKLIIWDEFFYLKSYSIQSLFSSPPFKRHDHSLKLDSCWKDIMGSCNGLVCILTKTEAFSIWNPSTGESKTFSVLDKNLRHNTDSVFGFGYDQLNNDYNVVQIEFNSSNLKEVRVYSLKNNSWRKIGNFPNGNPDPQMGTFVDGALHWTVTDANNSVSSFVIVSLDLGSKTYGEIAQPNFGLDYFTQGLVVLEGCFSVFCNIIDVRGDIWVMKEYGLRDSWVKLYTIPYTHISNKYGYMQSVLLSNPVTGEILLKSIDELVIYCPKNGTFRRQKISNMLTILEGATTYVESLASP